MFLPLNDIMLFIDVVSSKGFSAAAKKNNITPAAISKRISSLEENLGVQLIIRSTRSLFLTDAGKILYEECFLVGQQLKVTCAKISDINFAESGNIVVSAPTNFSNIVLASIVGEFQSQYKNIHIKEVIFLRE